VAIDGEEKLRRGFDEVESSGRRKVGKMGVCKCKSEFTRSSRTCFKLRKRHGKPEQVLASRRHAWRLGRRRRDVEEQGEGQREVRKAARVLGRHVAQKEAAWGQQVLGTWPARAAGVTGTKQSRGRGWRLKIRADL
jgi:hypothetical protein